MPTLEECLLYLGIDYADDAVNANVSRCLSAAGALVRGAVGEDVQTYLPDSEKFKELVLLYMADLYDERNTTQKVTAVNRRIIDYLEWQLKLELKQVKEDAE